MDVHTTKNGMKIGIDPYPYDKFRGLEIQNSKFTSMAREDFVAARYMLCTSASLERIIHLTGGFTLDCQKTWNGT